MISTLTSGRVAFARCSITFMSASLPAPCSRGSRPSSLRHPPDPRVELAHPRADPGLVLLGLSDPPQDVPPVESLEGTGRHGKGRVELDAALDVRDRCRRLPQPIEVEVVD